MKLEIRNITKKYDKNLVLENVNYTFHEGKIYSILGRNGCGKTTLFNIINRDIDAQSDEFLLDGNEVNDADVGMLYSENILPKFLTGYEYIKFFIDINEIKPQLTIDEYFDFMDFTQEDRHNIIKNYSHGMKSKISILGLLLSKKKIILLDEPLTSIDIIISNQIKKIIKKLKNEGHIIILSTHILELAKSLSDEIVILKDRKLSKFNVDKDSTSFDDSIVEALIDNDKID